jgi:hypothetical protein
MPTMDTKNSRNQSRNQSGIRDLMATVHSLPGRLRDAATIKAEFQALPKHIRNASSGIIWQGFSPVNGEAIMAIVSGLKTPSTNDKTGVMAQIDILVADQHPIEAIKTGADAAVCGACPLRPDKLGKRICYVTLAHAPASKFNAAGRGSYEMITPYQLGVILAYRNRGVRFGSYGDPAMLPFEVAQTILEVSGVKHTSYTHQWMEPWFDARHLSYSMASVDAENTVAMLHAIHPDARYYMLVDSYDSLPANTIACPSNSDKRNDDGSRQVTCADCGLCAGAARQAKNVAIVEGS